MSTLSINKLSEILAAALVERPDLLNKVSGAMAAGTMPAAPKPKRLTARQRRLEVMRSFNRQHHKENIRQKKAK